MDRISIGYYNIVRTLLLFTIISNLHDLIEVSVVEEKGELVPMQVFNERNQAS